MESYPLSEVGCNKAVVSTHILKENPGFLFSGTFVFVLSHSSVTQ